MAKYRANMRGPSVLSIQMMRVDSGKYDDRLLLGSNYRTIREYLLKIYRGIEN